MLDSQPKTVELSGPVVVFVMTRGELEFSPLAVVFPGTLVVELFNRSSIVPSMRPRVCCGGSAVGGKSEQPLSTAGLQPLASAKVKGNITLVTIEDELRLTCYVKDIVQGIESRVSRRKGQCIIPVPGLVCRLIPSFCKRKAKVEICKFVQ